MCVQNKYKKVLTYIYKACKYFWYNIEVQHCFVSDDISHKEYEVSKKQRAPKYKKKQYKHNINSKKAKVITKTTLTSHYCSHNKAHIFSKKINYPAPERNKNHILQVLKNHFDTEKPGNVIEIASGTGQHVSYFATHFPNLTFQPSEYDASLFGSIEAYIRDTPTKNIKNAVIIDITTDSSSWNLNNLYDYMININMIHISPFECTIGLFKNGCNVLKNGGILVTYGPYAVNGVITPESNVNFDKHLKAQNPKWGLRDIVDLKQLAGSFGIKLLQIYDLPANNKCLVWKKS